MKQETINYLYIGLLYLAPFTVMTIIALTTFSHIAEQEMGVIALILAYGAFITPMSIYVVGLLIHLEIIRLKEKERT